MPEAGALLTATALTHVGAVRARNEDTVAVDDWVMSRSMDAPVTLQRVVLTPMVCLVADGLLYFWSHHESCRFRA